MELLIQVLPIVFVGVLGYFIGGFTTYMRVRRGTDEDVIYGTFVGLNNAIKTAENSSVYTKDELLEQYKVIFARMEAMFPKVATMYKKNREKVDTMMASLKNG